jgi:hypothetical protein
VRDVHQKSPEELYKLCFTIDDEIIKFAPINLLQKLLNKSIFSGTSPYDCVILVTHQETDRHDSKISCIDWRPSLSTLMDFLANQTEHSGDAWPTDIDIEEPDFILL